MICTIFALWSMIGLGTQKIPTPVRTRTRFANGSRPTFVLNPSILLPETIIRRARVKFVVIVAQAVVKVPPSM
jgi:hypothetical protein